LKAGTQMNEDHFISNSSAASGDEKNGLLVQERRNRILEKLANERMVKAAELVGEFNVSMETIRRDLEYLGQLGYLERVYGGAVCKGFYGLEPDYSHREIKNLFEKQAIAAKTAELIENGDTLFIDVGTTMLELAKCLTRKSDLTVITNSTQIALTLVGNPSNRIILLGGELRSGELSVSGFLCEYGLQRFNANKAILGVGGLTIDGGISDYHINEAVSRRLMIERADKVIAATDFSKFGVKALNSVCPLKKIHVLVTDWSVPDKTLREYRDAGLKIIVAPESASR